MDKLPSVPKPKKGSDSFSKYSGMAFQLFAVIALSMWAGFTLDKYLMLKIPIFTVLFSLLAVIGTMISIIKSLS
jgi:ATP synthase protein I